MRQAKADVLARQTQIDELTATQAQTQTTAQSQRQMQQTLADLEQQLAVDQEHYQRLKNQEQIYRTLRPQLDLLQQQLSQVQGRQAATQAAIANLQAQLQEGEHILAQAPAIAIGLAKLQALEAEEADLNQQFQRYQSLQRQHQQLEADYGHQGQAIDQKLHQSRLQLCHLEAQLGELEPILAKTDEVKAAQQQLRAARARLKHLDALQLQAEPLVKRCQQLQTERQKAQTRLQTHLEDLTNNAQQLQAQQAEQPHLVTAVQKVSQTLGYLEQRRAYQEQVREKGLERRAFMEALQANQRTYETQMAQIDQKLRLLQQPEATCPLCERSLGKQRRALVANRHRLQQQEIQDQIWVIREQLAVSEREIQVLRQEYRAIEAELELYAPVLHKQGQLEAQLATQATVQDQLQQLEAERQRLQRCLDENSYATDLEAELRHLDQTLHQLAYDERDHALARARLTDCDGPTSSPMTWIRPAAASNAWRPSASPTGYPGQLETSLGQLQRSPLSR
ncbi:MAG: ATP-binding cassette family protein, partial [Leptolyngbyaceae cyanobacterium SM2_3_12]|nr:ATP-binding cassette family protein [Leptolyngbyaceae cyanobacterium SM2_3_12]